MCLGVPCVSEGSTAGMLSYCLEMVFGKSWMARMVDERGTATVFSSAEKVS